jgi:hypothetical protein
MPMHGVDVTSHGCLLAVLQQQGREKETLTYPAFTMDMLQGPMSVSKSAARPLLLVDMAISTSLAQAFCKACLNVSASTGDFYTCGVM